MKIVEAADELSVAFFINGFWTVGQILLELEQNFGDQYTFDPA